jgi:hypothetical protein
MSSNSSSEKQRIQLLKLSEVDATLILAGQPATRGLFVRGTAHVLASDDKYPKVDPVVIEQAVFIASNMSRPDYPCSASSHIILVVVVSWITMPWS